MKGAMRASVVAIVLMGLASVPAVAAPPRDNREMQAREAFAAGRYQEALDVFVKLYAEKLHPNYLRNIGRCYQNLGEPDKAISSFREYLRKAKGVTPEERAEIDGYIKEMEELKQQRSAPPPPPRPEPKLEAPPPPVVEERPSTLLAPVAPAPEPSPPFYTRWWFWGAIGGAAAVAAVVLLTRPKDPSCGGGRVCP
jgi:hypothetical protein